MHGQVPVVNVGRVADDFHDPPRVGSTEIDLGVSHDQSRPTICMIDFGPCPSSHRLPYGGLYERKWYGSCISLA